MVSDKKKEKKSLYVKSSTFAAIFGTAFTLTFAAISVLTANINTKTKNLADEMKKVNDYQQSATMLQTGTSILSETATSFVHAPVIPNGPDSYVINTGSIGAYAQELQNDRRPATIVKLFEEYDVSDEVKEYINNAAGYSSQMFEIQTHALSVVISVYPLPADPIFDLIPLVPLTEQEQAMSDEARLGYAKSLVAQKDFSLLKSYVSQNIEKCHQSLQARVDNTFNDCQKDIRAMRVFLWAMILLGAILLFTIILLFYLWSVRPLRQYAKDMHEDRLLEPIGRVAELHTMVSAYNELFLHRNELESILRTAAEKDALTDLNNRYSMEQDTINIEKHDGSVTVVFFDVNYLKNVNDKYGHLKGDELLKTVADNIKEYFGIGSCNNCYRIGGDEFAAILRDNNEEDIKFRIKHFIEANKSKNISVSVGYAYSNKLSEGDFAKLIELADQRMYEYKKAVHDKRFE